MKKIYFLDEFKEYYNKIHPHTIIYDTANQSWVDPSDSMKIKSIFTKIEILFNPNVLLLKSESCTISFGFIKYIELITQSALGIIFSIVCEDKQHIIVLR